MHYWTRSESTNKHSAKAALKGSDLARSNSKGLKGTRKASLEGTRSSRSKKSLEKEIVSQAFINDLEKIIDIGGGILESLRK
jgi:hypothetical protein